MGGGIGTETGTGTGKETNGEMTNKDIVAPLAAEVKTERLEGPTVMRRHYTTSKPCIFKLDEMLANPSSGGVQTWVISRFNIHSSYLHSMYVHYLLLLFMWIHHR